MNLYVVLMTGNFSVQVSFDKLDKDTDQTWWNIALSTMFLPSSHCTIKWKIAFHISHQM